MEVVCSNCLARLKIPDEKIPETGRVTAGCPKCGGKISVGRPRPEVEPSPTRETSDTDRAISHEDSEYRDAEPFSLDFYGEGTKLCLLMLGHADADGGIEEAAEGLLFRTVVVKDAGEAINKMRFHHFDLMILSEHFEQVGWEQSPILHYLNRIPMHTRRKIFLVLLGREFSTMDRMAAFGLSADLVVNPGDANEIAGILKAAFWNHENFYGGFTEIQNALGKG
ncbi:conserved domain protein [delta proteobacterium NaphS2]|nr:conserved domain protein [delta proteobacterium NaphS2]